MQVFESAIKNRAVKFIKLMMEWNEIPEDLQKEAVVLFQKSKEERKNKESKVDMIKGKLYLHFPYFRWKTGRTSLKQK